MDAQAEFEALRQRAAVLGVIPQQIAMALDGRVRLAVLDYARFSGDQPPFAARNPVGCVATRIGHCFPTRRRGVRSLGPLPDGRHRH